MLFIIKSFVLQSGADLATWRRDKQIAMAVLFAFLGISFLGVQIRIFGLEIGDRVWVEALDLGSTSVRAASPALQSEEELELVRNERINSEEMLKDMDVMIGYHSDRLDALRSALKQMEHSGQNTHAGMYEDLTIQDIEGQAAEAENILAFLREQYAKDARALDELVAREDKLERECDIADTQLNTTPSHSDSPDEFAAYLAQGNAKDPVTR